VGDTTSTTACGQGETDMALIKVQDLAYGRLRAPDLDVMEEFLTHFGMLRAARRRSLTTTLNGLPDRRASAFTRAATSSSNVRVVRTS